MLSDIFPRGLKPDKNPGIYCVVYASRFYYVGSSLSLLGRKKAHLLQAETRHKVSRSVRAVLDRYEDCSVVFRVLTKFNSIDDDTLRKKETFWIRRFIRVFGEKRVLNTRIVNSNTNAGTSWKTGPRPLEVRQLISLKVQAHFDKPGSKARQSAMLVTLWKDPEYRAKILAARKATVDSPDHRAYLSARAKAQWKAKPLSDESRRIMSEKRKAYHARMRLAA